MFDYVKFDPLRLIEAGFDPDLEDDRWLDGIVDVCAAGLDPEWGAVGYMFERDDDRWVRSAPHYTGRSDCGLKAFDERLPRETPTLPFVSAVGATTGRDSAVSRLSDGLGLAAPDLMTFAATAAGSVDRAAAMSGAQRAFAFYAPLPAPWALEDKERELWRTLGSIISGALAVRGDESLGRDEEENLPVSSGDEIMPRISIVQPQAQLRGLAQTVDSSSPSGASRHYASRFMRLWSGVASGRWSFVDRFDADGRRFVIARRNNPRTVRAGSALSLRERQVLFYAALAWKNPEIARLLSLAPTTVATHLRRALDKLGLDGRNALLSIGTAIQLLAPADSTLH